MARNYLSAGQIKHCSIQHENFGAPIKQVIPQSPVGKAGLRCGRWGGGDRQPDDIDFAGAS